MALSMKRKATGLKGKPKSKGFVYHERSVDSVKRRAERTGGRFDSIFKPGFDSWRAKQGDNLIRYLPPTWDDHEHFGYTIYVHSYVGADNSTYLCPQKMLGKPCPICAAAKEARDGGEPDEAKQLQWKEQLVSWIVDRDDDNLKPVLFQCSWTFDRDIMALTIDKRKGNILLIDHPDEGFDISFQRSGSGLNTRYFGQQVDRQSSPISDDDEKQQEILDYISSNPIPDCLQFFDAAKLEAVLSGTVASKDEDLEEESNTEEESDNEGREAHSSRRRARDEEEEDSEPEERPRRRARDEEDDEPEPEPRARVRGRREEPEEDEPEEKPRRRNRDEEEDDLEPEERPARLRSSRSKDEEDEPEETPRHRSRDEEDEPEEKPRRRARDEEEDEPEERPRRARSR